MDIEQITKLIDAGYTKADIDAMQAGNNDSPETNKGAGTENQTKGKGESGAAPENENKVTNNTTDFDAALKTLTETVTGLTETVKAMQAANVAGAQTNGGGDKTINDVMKSFIDTL